MSQPEWLQLGVAVALTIIAMLLAAAEAALATLSKARAQELADDGVNGAARLVDITADKAPFINASTLLRVIAQVCAGLLVAQLVFSHFDALWERLLITGAILVLVWFILWGVGPATLGRQHASGVALRAARPLAMLTTVLGPVAQLLILIGNAITPGKGYAEGPFSSEAELRELVDIAEQAEVIEHDEREMIHSVFEFGDTLAREVMVPRTDIVFIEEHKTLRQGLSLALRSGFSRIPVIGADLDDVTGVVYLKDLVNRIYEFPDSERKEQVSALMRPAAFVPDSKPVDELLREMQQTRSHLVIVVDEFGGTAGLATMEDIVEEIVGEITDEYDADPMLAEPLGDAFRVSARMALDDMGDLFGLELHDEDVETVGGLLAKQLNMAPIPGSQVTWEGLELTAEKASGRRHQVDTVLVRRVPEPTDDPEGNPDE